MKESEVKRFTEFYERHLDLLKIQGKSETTRNFRVQVNAKGQLHG